MVVAGGGFTKERGREGLITRALQTGVSPLCISWVEFFCYTGCCGHFLPSWPSLRSQTSSLLFQLSSHLGITDVPRLCNSTQPVHWKKPLREPRPLSGNLTKVPLFCRFDCLFNLLCFLKQDVMDSGWLQTQYVAKNVLLILLPPPHKYSDPRHVILLSHFSLRMFSVCMLCFSICKHTHMLVKPRG